MSKETTQELLDLSPSAKLVFTVLEHEEQLTQKQLAEETMLTSQTVGNALTQLEDIGEVSERIHLADTRQSIYEVVGHR